MAATKEWLDKLATDALDEPLFRLYGEEALPVAKERLRRTICQFTEVYGTREELRVFSAPGRTELCGNHIDHQHGRGLAATVALDKLAVAAPNRENRVSIWSPSHPIRNLNCRDLSHHEAEWGHSPSLIRGIYAAFLREGRPVGGFDAVTDSLVPAGSGLSSSASIEILLGALLSGLYGGELLPPLKLAEIGQYAENCYYGKPSGLLDQLSCALGGAQLVDLKNPAAPAIESVPAPFPEWEMALYVVYAGKSHSDLKEDFAAIPNEMRRVANYFGREYLRDVEEEEFYASIGALRGRLPDRAILRAMHFFEENRRVLIMAKALREKDKTTYCREMIAAGQSSFCRLQNIFPLSEPEERSIALALALSEQVLAGAGGWRVHGGGFSGTIQALVPYALEKDFLRVLEGAFGTGSCYRLRIRPVGGAEITA